jgi:hypothetical protein
MADFNPPPGPPIGGFAWLDRRAREDQEMHMRMAASGVAHPLQRPLTEDEIAQRDAVIAEAKANIDAPVKAAHQFVTETFDDPYERAIVSGLMKIGPTKYDDSRNRAFRAPYIQAINPEWDWISGGSPWYGNWFAPWFAQRATDAGIETVEARWPVFEWVTGFLGRGNGHWQERFVVERGWKLPGGSDAPTRWLVTEPELADAYVLVDGRFFPCVDTLSDFHRQQLGTGPSGFNLYGIRTMAEMLSFLPAEVEFPGGVVLEQPQPAARPPSSSANVETPQGTPEQRAAFEAEWSEIEKFLRRNGKLVKDYQRAKKGLGWPYQKSPNSVPGGSKMMKTIQKVESRCPAMKYLCDPIHMATKEEAWVRWRNKHPTRV